MKSNLFLGSFKHLDPNIDKKHSNVVLKETNITSEESKPPSSTKNTINPSLIYLGKGKVYTDPIKAYNALLSIPTKEIPTKYRNTLTKAFFNGTETGQITSLFKDWKKYKEKILPKISEFFFYIKNNPEKCVLCKKYVSFVVGNKNPVDKETYVDDVVDLMYFKFWVLFKFFVEMKGKIGTSG